MGHLTWGKKDDIVCLTGEEKWPDFFHLHGGANYRKWAEIATDLEKKKKKHQKLLWPQTGERIW